MKKITIILLSLILLTACNSGAERFTFEMNRDGDYAPFDHDYRLTVYNVADDLAFNKYYLPKNHQGYLEQEIYIGSQGKKEIFKHTFSLDQEDWKTIHAYLYRATIDKDSFWTEEFLNDATGIAYEINGKTFYSYAHPRFFNRIERLVKSDSDFQYDFSFCEQMGEQRYEQYLLKDGCYVDIAIALNNPQLCQKVTPGEASDNCRGNVFYKNASEYTNFATEEFCSQLPETVVDINDSNKTNPVRAKCLELVQL